MPKSSCATATAATARRTSSRKKFSVAVGAQGLAPLHLCGEQSGAVSKPADHRKHSEPAQNADGVPDGGVEPQQAKLAKHVCPIVDNVFRIADCYQRPLLP